jgi:DNA-binding response OmpR family regulator
MPPGRPRRHVVLVVDDDTASTDLLAKILRPRYEVMVANDGVQGFEMATKSRPDLIITDVTMPRLDGLAMVRLIRARLHSKLPVILLTGRNAAADIIAGIGAGALHYLTKPVNIADLESRVARALSF